MAHILTGFTTLVLHQAEPANTLVRLIEAEGGKVIVSPVLRNSQLDDDSPNSQGIPASSNSRAGWEAQPASADALGAWLDGDVDAVVLTSRAEVQEFAKQFNPLEAIPEMAPYFPVLIALDVATTVAAQANGLSVDLVAHQATHTGLFDAVLRAAELTEELDQLR